MAGFIRGRVVKDGGEKRETIDEIAKKYTGPALPVA